MPNAFWATSRKWYVVCDERPGKLPYTGTAFTPPASGRSAVAVPYAVVGPYSNQYVVGAFRGFAVPDTSAWV